jgi:hypothetical protein
MLAVVGGFVVEKKIVGIWARDARFYQRNRKHGETVALFGCTP